MLHLASEYAIIEGLLNWIVQILRTKLHCNNKRTITVRLRKTGILNSVKDKFLHRFDERQLYKLSTTERNSI